jgi:hypothetical protein
VKLGNSVLAADDASNIHAAQASDDELIVTGLFADKERQKALIGLISLQTGECIVIHSVYGMENQHRLMHGLDTKQDVSNQFGEVSTIIL